MKSIANQYRDLKEGKMSQSNFMRNLRMSMPQYITNVTSFNDAVKILKNKAILTESEQGSPSIDQMSREEMIDFLGTTSSIVKDLTDDELRDIVKDKNADLGEAYDGPSEPRGNEALGDYYEAVAESLEDIARQKYRLDEKEIDQMFDIEWHSGKNDNVIRKYYKAGDEPSVVAERIIEDYMEDNNMSAMISKIGGEEEAEKAIKGGFGIYDPLEEADGQFPRDPVEMAQVIANEFGDELLTISGKQKQDMALSRAYEKILNSGHPKAKIIARNLVFGYADEDWPMDYISALNQKLKNLTPEIPGFEGTRDALDDLSIKEGKKKEPKSELHPNQIHPGELRMGIRVEMEHTDDPEKAKKIALDHLAENPYYYTALKLSGVESPSAPKVKAPKDAPKKAKKKDATELVDKTNQMQKVKMPKIVKEVRINAMPGEETNATVKHAMQYIDSDIANPTLKALSNDLELQPLRDNRAILRYGYWEKMPDEALAAVKMQFNVEEDIDTEEDKADSYIYIISSKKKPGNLGSSLDMGASKAGKMDAFKEALEKIVREVVAETFDGRDNLANITDDTK